MGRANRHKEDASPVLFVVLVVLDTYHAEGTEALLEDKEASA